MSGYKSFSQTGDPEYFVGIRVDSIDVVKNRVVLKEGTDYSIDSNGIITYANPWLGESCEIIENYSDDMTSKIDSILTATIGSWQWDKRNSILTMYDVNGNPKFVYEVADHSESAKKERRQDLE